MSQVVGLTVCGSLMSVIHCLQLLHSFLRPLPANSSPNLDHDSPAVRKENSAIAAVHQRSGILTFSNSLVLVDVVDGSQERVVGG